MNSLKNLEESMGCNTIRDDHGGGVIYQRVHMDKAEFDEMLGKVEEEYSGLQAENAKLRELIRTVWLAGDFCAFLGADEIKERMRELGIEG